MRSRLALFASIAATCVAAAMFALPWVLGGDFFSPPHIFYKGEQPDIPYGVRYQVLRHETHDGVPQAVVVAADRAGPEIYSSAKLVVKRPINSIFWLAPRKNGYVLYVPKKLSVPSQQPAVTAAPQKLPVKTHDDFLASRSPAKPGG